MMINSDFIVKYDPAKDNIYDLTDRILYSVFIRRMKANKPNVIFIGGDSGEGKSWTGLSLQDALLRLQGHDLVNYLNAVNVFTPLEYPEKLDAHINNKELKKINIICMHEAREIVKAKKWNSFLTMSVADINAQVRGIKRMTIMIISQFIRDISTDIRYTLTHYITVRRGLTGDSRHVKARIEVMWKDDTDLEKPKLRKRGLAGYIVYPDGRYRRFYPKWIELRPPRKELSEAFDSLDMLAKKRIIQRKIDKLVKELKLEFVDEKNKITAMIKYYTEDLDRLKSIGKKRGQQWKINPEVRDMHDLSPSEFSEFKKALTEHINTKGLSPKRPVEYDDVEDLNTMDAPAKNYILNPNDITSENLGELSKNKEEKEKEEQQEEED